MKPKAIPLVKAAFKKQFENAMLKNGLSPDYYFKEVNLPTHAQEDPESLLPEKPFWHLANLVSVDGEIPDYGAQTAQLTPWHKVESMMPLICSRANLEDLLHTFCKIAPGQSSSVRFALEQDESELWFSYIGKPLIKNDIQMELYRVTCMIQLVQLAAGSGWYPKQIELLMPEKKVVSASRLISKSRITFSQARSGFSIPNLLLKLPINIEIPYIKTSRNQYDINADFVLTILQLISIFISNKNCNLDDIARITELPKRTLQRRLKSHGTCFNDLLNQAKFNLAKDKLENSCATITEISFQLGYSGPSHFNHAFHRWAGMSPSQFRAEQKA